LALKFQAVAEKTAKDARGLLYFAAPGIVKLIKLFYFILIAVFVSLLPLMLLKTDYHECHTDLSCHRRHHEEQNTSDHTTTEEIN